MTSAVVIENAPAVRRESWLARHPAWPVTLLLAGIPLWWALGVADYMVILIAIPMAARLYAWSAQGDRRIRVPPGFALWAMFLVLAVAGAAALPLTAPGTTASPVSNRLISYGIRTAGYLGVTVILLFTGNLTERELPRKRLAWLLGLVGLYAAFGGLAGVFLPRLRFTSPLAAIVPNRFQNGNQVLQAELHPALAQLQSVLSTSHGRPDAPFVYTNSWGNCLAILLPWLLAAWWFQGTRRQRLIAATGLAVAFVPTIYSLDRGLWLGLLVAFIYLGVRLAAQGRTAVLATLIGGLALAAVLIAASPLQSVISHRLDNGASNDRRGSLAVAALVDAAASPLIGYGDTRHQQGSVQSVAVGRTASCGTCGNGTIGGNGQLWLLLICNGFLGTAFYLSFFAFGCWRYRRDKTPYGLAGVLVLLLSFVFMIAYNAIGLPLGFTMLAYVMLWRNDRARREEEPPAVNGPVRMTGPPMRVTAAEAGSAALHPGILATRYAAAPVTGTAPRGGARHEPTDAFWSDPPTGANGHRSPDAARTAAYLDEQGRLAGVARGGAANLAGAVVAAVTTLAITVLVTRHYSQPVAGAFFTAISLFLIIEAVASLGAYVGAINFIARLRRLGRDDQIPIILRAALVPVVVVSILAGAAMFVFAGPLAHILLRGHLGHSGATPGLVADALRALAIALPCSALADTFLGMARGYREMRPTVLVDKVGRSSGQLIGVLVAVSAGSAALLAPLWAAPYILSAVAAWFWFRRIRWNQESRPVRQLAASRLPGRAGGLDSRAEGGITPSAGADMNTATTRGFWRFTAPRAFANLTQITLQRIDIVLVAIIIGPAQAAIYTAATRFLVAGQFSNTAIIMAAQPRFAELFAVGNRRGAGQVYQVTTAWLIMMTWPLYLLAVIYGPVVLSLFGHSYRAGDTVMVILGLTMLLWAACGQVDTVLITLGRSGWSLANGTMALVVNVGLDVLLIPRYGITGAAIGWSAAIVVSNLTPLAQLAFKYRLHPFGRGALIAAGLATLSFAVIPLAARATLGHGPAVSIGAVAAGCCVQVAGWWWFRGSLHLATIPGLGRLQPNHPVLSSPLHDHAAHISRLIRAGVGRKGPTG